MQVLKLNEKQGFYTDGPVEIYDKRGLFLRYIKPTYFNLPPGIYTVAQGMVSSLQDGPVKYEPLELAPHTKPQVDKNNIKIEAISSPEPAKMDIDYQNGIMRINPKWEATLTTPEYEFATRHECGHFFYHADPYGQYQCDRLAAQTMLEDGFNPQQVALASHSTLCGQCKENMEADIPEESAQRRFNMEMEMLETSLQAKYARLDPAELMDVANLAPE